MSLRRWQRISLLLITAYAGTTFLAALTVNEGLSPGGCLPGYLRERTRDDYSYLFKLFRWVPWTWTSWCFVEPPRMILGNQKGRYPTRDHSATGPKPIPEPGEWQLSVVQVRPEIPLWFLPYFAWTTKKGNHFSAGCRWDDIDHYYVFPRIAIKNTRKID
jgi:hypothetical protein